MRLISFFCYERGVKKRKVDVLVHYHQGCYSNTALKIASLASLGLEKALQIML